MYSPNRSSGVRKNWTAFDDISSDVSDMIVSIKFKGQIARDLLKYSIIMSEVVSIVAGKQCDISMYTVIEPFSIVCIFFQAGDEFF